MALLRSKLENQIRPANKDFEWRESVDDLFDSFINPDSFNFSDNEVQRDHPDDLINLFDSHTASSNSDTIDTSPMLDIDAKDAVPDFSWLQIPPFGEENGTVSASLEHRTSIYPASRGRTAGSDSDLLGLDFLSTSQLDSPISTRPAHPPTYPSTPISSSLKQFSTPLVIRKKQRSPPSRIEKHRSATRLPVKMMSPSHYKEQALWTRRIGAAADQLNLKVPFEGRPAALPSPGQFKSASLSGYPFASDHSKSGPYADEIEPLSPFSNLQHHFQPPNTPIASPIFDDRQPGSRTSFPEALSAGISKTPMNQNPDPFSALITPPQSAQMSSANWMSALSDQSISASPAFSSSGDKADSWWCPGAGESTCDATPSAGLIGLGIEGMHMSDNLASASSLMMPCDPSPTFTAPMAAASSTQSAVAPSLVNGVNRPLASPISVSASPFNLQYPLSPLQTISSSMSQSQQQSQQQKQKQQPTFYRHHQRHHTVGTPIAIGQTNPYNTRSARLNSASPGPRPIRPHHHKRSKSSHHARRKSSAEKASSQDGPRSASIGFVNFTPDDSKKILTGVAPSGSSKTKARREKEAAEKRRKLSEAAKKAVLEAGGDLETLEREGLLVMEQGL